MTFADYMEYKNAFIERHRESDWRIDTSPMDRNGTYVKTYIFEDGAVLWEVNRHITEKVEVETFVHGVRVLVSGEVELEETESWNTDDARIVKFYEEW